MTTNAKGWIVFGALQTAQIVIHTALHDPVLLQQGTRSYSLWSLIAVALVFVIGLIRSPIGRKVTGIETEVTETTIVKTTSPEPLPLPPPPKAGEL